MNLKFIISLHLVILLITSAQSQDLVPDDIEFNALKDLYLSTNGDSWNNNDGWPASGSWPTSSTSAVFDGWHGITVTNGDITNITIENNNLNGPIPESIGNLERLNVLRLNSNMLHDSIPPQLCSLKNLEELQIPVNNISGTIPVCISQLTKLKTLNLGYNDIQGPLPQGLDTLRYLHTLALESNLFGGTLPIFLTQSSSLEVLRLRGNNFSGNIPPEYFNMFNLKELDLRSNLLEGEIPTAHNFLNLQKLYLSHNPLEGEIPPSLCTILSLQKLDLAQNNLLGTIPECIGDLSELNELHLSRNNLEGNIPASIGNLTKLINLYLDHNNLSGEVPSTFTNLTKMRSLVLGTLPELRGIIPEGIATSPDLKAIKVSGTMISGIPRMVDHPNAANIIIDVRNAAFSPAELEKNMVAPDTFPFLGYYIGNQKYLYPKTLAFVSEDTLRISGYEAGNYGTVVWEKEDSSTSTWQNIDHLNASPDPVNFIINSFSSSDKGNYRFRITNSWLPQDFNSPSIKVMEDKGILYAVSPGAWDNPEIWSFEENGPAVELIPDASRSVFISGIIITIEKTAECKNLTLNPHTSETTRLIINGELKSDSVNIIDDPAIATPCTIDIINSGKFLVKSPPEGS